VMDNYTEALANQLKALNLLDSLGMQSEYANLLSQVASIHSNTGAHDRASKYYGESLLVYEHLHDTNSMLTIMYYLGKSLLNAGDTAHAWEIIRKSLDLAQKPGDTFLQAFAFNDMGNSYKGTDLDSSIYFLNEAFKIWDTLHFAQKGFNLLLTAEAYYSFGPDYYKDAEEYYLRCYDVFKFTGRQGRIRLCYGLADLYFQTERYEKCRGFLDDALKMNKSFLLKHNHQMNQTLNEKLENEVYFKSYMEKIYGLYYRLYSALNNESSAFHYYILATQWKDSVYNEQSRKKIAMIQGRYETERIQNHISMLEKENEVKDLRINQSRFFLVGMGAFVLVIILMALLFIRQNKIRAEHRTVLMEQKLLRLQMNPHFIFNALSNILNLINRNDTPVASKYLSKFSKLLRSTLEGSRQDTIKLEKEIDGLENYLELQKLRFGEKFEYEIHVDEKIDTESTMIPPLLVQPFIENAIEHGIKHKKTKGHVNLRFLAEENQVVCEIEDDGIGREKAWEINYEKRKDHKSLATTIIEERIRNLNKNLKNKIRFKIIDLKSEDNVALGTKVVIGIPQAGCC